MAISAGVYRGVRVTGSLGIKDDLVNADARSGRSQRLVVDRHFISSRKPDDLPDFCRGILEVAGEQKNQSTNFSLQQVHDSRSYPWSVRVIGILLISLPIFLVIYIVGRLTLTE